MKPWDLVKGTGNQNCYCLVVFNNRCKNKFLTLLFVTKYIQTQREYLFSRAHYFQNKETRERVDSLSRLFVTKFI
jgi:hypothetical protein